MAAITCLLVDDHPAVLDAIEELLLADGILVAGRARTGAEALAFDLDDVTVVVTDVRLPDITGLDVARELLRRQPNRLVILYTATITPAGASAALGAGVRGVVLKDSVPRELPAAIREVAGGGTHLDRRIR